MDITHEQLIIIARYWGLIYLIAMSVGVIVYVLWPGKKKTFQRAANNILDNASEDRPCL